jgi:alkylation response protein AidB-like acyl-CoA dehydrogenase
MDFELPEELAEVQKLAHDFAEKEIAPGAAQDDREHRFRKDLVGKMGELGFYGCLIPEEFGGNQREQFGEKIGRFQMNQDLIAQMIVQEEAARLLVYRAASLADRGRPYNLEVSIAKYAAAEAAAFCADTALKILGAYGYSTEFPVERYYRDAKSYQIVEGSVNIQKLIIAQDALGYRKANR